MRLIHKGLILVGVPFVVAILLIALMFGLIRHSDQQRLENERQRRVKEIQTKIMMLWCDMSPDLMIMSRSPEANRSPPNKVSHNLSEIRRLHGEALQLDPDLNADPEQISFQRCIQAFTNKLKAIQHLSESRDFSFDVGHQMADIPDRIAPLMHKILQEPHTSVKAKIEQLKVQYREE